MERARYGRMRAGRCVSGYGKLGCSVNVLWYMDRRCSGRRHCRVYVADPVLHGVDVCHSDLTSYLEAKYTCITGTLNYVDNRKRHIGGLGGVTVTGVGLAIKRGRGFDSRSDRYQATYVISAFHPSGVGKLSTNLSGWG